MSNRPKILWIEDSARFELAELLGPVFYTRKYMLTLAEDASSAAYHLTDQSFDALIVDVRLPPGNDPIWRQLYQQAGSDRIRAQLGLRLLEWLLLPDAVLHQSISVRPQSISREKIAVFTVDSRGQIENELAMLGIGMYEQKKVSLPDTALLDLIELILNRGRALRVL